MLYGKHSEIIIILLLFFFFCFFINTFGFSFSQIYWTNSIGFTILGFWIFSLYSSSTAKHFLLKIDFRLISFSDTSIFTWRVLDNNNPIYFKYKVFPIEWWQGDYHNDYWPKNQIILTTTIFLAFSLGF